MGAEPPDGALPAIDWREAPDRPVFVGGTGRSGTTIAGRLLGHHRDLRATNPRELRFIASTGGVADAYATAVGSAPVAQGVRPEDVVESLWAYWYERVKPSGARGGLYRRLDRDRMAEVCRRYVEEFGTDPYAASRCFTETIVSADVRRDPESRWVDTTPANARVADRILALFPEGVVVHMMRDGRDVAASFVSKPFGPKEVFAGLDAWRDRMIEAWRAEQASPSGRVVRIDLQELAVTHRDETLQRLLSAIGVDDDRRMRQWFDAKVLPQQAHVGRWRRDYDEETARRIDERYAAIIGELDDLGVPRPA
ncbi:MAG: sulfotransferase family protein [bacterium]